MLGVLFLSCAARSGLSFLGEVQYSCQACPTALSSDGSNRGNPERMKGPLGVSALSSRVLRGTQSSRPEEKKIRELLQLLCTELQLRVRFPRVHMLPFERKFPLFYKEPFPHLFLLYLRRVKGF